MSARVINQHLAACGLQHRNAQDEWQLTLGLLGLAQC